MSADKDDVTSIFDYRTGSASFKASALNNGEDISKPLELGSLERCALVEMAKRIVELRRSRCRYFPGNFFSEPAWDIMLILYIEAGQRPLAATGAAHVTDTPETTALRWVEALESAGFVNSHTHASDRRVRLLVLSSYGRAMLDQYLSEILRK